MIFQFALHTYIIKEDLTTVYSALAVGAKYLASSAKESTPNNQERVDKKEKDSPQHAVESVSEEEIVAAQAAWENDIHELPKVRAQKKEV